MKYHLLSQEATTLSTVMGYSCVINQWHLKCDCVQCDVFVPVFHTDVMQAAGYVLQLKGATHQKTIM